MIPPEIAGWVPAVVFPTASLLQLLRLLKIEDTEALSVSTWLMMALANICMFIFMEKYWAPQAILANLLNAAIQIVIVAIALRKRRRH